MPRARLPATDQPFNADLHTPLFLDQYREYDPHPALQNQVRSYWSMEEFHTTRTEKHRFYPERLVRLCFYQGEAFFPDASSQWTGPLPNMYMLGFQKEPIRFVSRGLTRVVGVEMYPWAARALLQGDRNLQDIFFQPLQASLQHLSAEVLALIQLNAIQEALEAIEAWLLQRLPLQDIQGNAGIQAALSLYHLKGQGKISELAEVHGVSVRQLERQFHSSVGITPKTLSKIIRFEEAHNALWVNPHISLTELAFELGFADQAHFCREFRGFTHITPGEFSRHVQEHLLHRDHAAQHHSKLHMSNTEKPSHSKP
ncbi:helix-turn-helix domain-containing protein [Deinococcus roseus]|uniref:AraC family transcriptional regulator n=1 Tax=Deinococcus roseus TaxID=392414 RepID=A0ABQ2CWQ3_9DEIO|nr:helix-turn-helix domain-containing protein [Deinococcus roseus]GGJ24659.1 AraC family transcriptional regulator [Deinococcus roseus]